LAECTPGDELPSPQRQCPHCGDSRTRRWGFFRSSQRYRCRQCGRTFNALTGTRYARLRSAELWLDYRAAVVAQLSVRRAADACGISVPTALRWRRRIGPPPDLANDREQAAAHQNAQDETRPAQEAPARGVIDFVEWARAATAVEDGGAMRDRLDGLFGAASNELRARRPGGPGEK
jgi:transposase-like protein